MLLARAFLLALPLVQASCVDDDAAAHELYLSLPTVEVDAEVDTGESSGCAELLAFGPPDTCEASGHFSTCCKTCTDLAEFKASLPCPTGPADATEMLFATQGWEGRSGYDRRQRPPAAFHTPFMLFAPTAPYQGVGWPATKVQTLIMPVRMGSLDQQKQSVTVDYAINFAWYDSRLAFNDSCLADRAIVGNPTDPLQTAQYLPPYFDDPRDLIWVPRIIVDNAFPDGSQPSESERSHRLLIHPSGRVWWSYRANYRIKCSMDFKKMPFDEQHCHVRMLSVEDRHRVHIFPASATKEMLEGNESVLALEDMSNTEWSCQQLSQASGGNLARRLDGELEYFDLRFSLKRNTYFWKSQVIAPVCLVVAITYFSFFIDREAVVRIIVGILCFLTLSNQRSTVVATLPRLPYSVDLQQFLLVSMCFVFFAIFEYALAHYLMRIEKRIEAVVAKVKAGEAKRMADELGASNRSSRSSMGSSVVFPSDVQLDKDAINAKYRKSHHEEIKALLTGVDKYNVDKHGQVILRDQHLDIACRYLYPLCYSIYVVDFLTGRSAFGMAALLCLPATLPLVICGLRTLHHKEGGRALSHLTADARIDVLIARWREASNRTEGAGERPPCPIAPLEA